MKIAIKETDLRSLSMDIIKLVDEINDIFNLYDNRFYDLKDFYQGKCSIDLNRFYSDVRTKFPIVKNNLLSYSKDFVAFIGKMHDESNIISSMAQESTDKVKKTIANFDEKV